MLVSYVSTISKHAYDVNKKLPIEQVARAPIKTGTSMLPNPPIKAGIQTHGLYLHLTPVQFTINVLISIAIVFCKVHLL